MSEIPRHIDQVLFFKVLGGVSLILLAFAEIALGQFPIFYGTTPFIMVIVMVYLALYLPVAVPPLAVVLAGLVFDLLQGAPPGFTSSILLLAVMTVKARRRLLLHADATKVWYEFALMLAGLQIYAFIVIMLWVGSMPSVGGFIFQYAMTVLIFPMLSWTAAPLKQMSQWGHAA